MLKSYTNSFIISTIDELGNEVEIKNFADANNLVEVAYRSFNKKVDVAFERAIDAGEEKQLTNIVIRFSNTSDPEIATIKPKFDISDLSWYGNSGGVVGYVDTFPPVIDPENPTPGVDARTSFRLESADECIVLRVDGGVESIQALSVLSFSVGYKKPYANREGRIHTVVSEVYNKGPNAAESADADIVIDDELVVHSVEVSTGAYDELTGEWEIGDLQVGEQAAIMIKASNPTEYDATVTFTAASDTENPNDAYTETTIVVPGEPNRPFVINEATGEVTEGFTIPYNKTRPDSPYWEILRVHPEGVALLRRTVGGVNKYMAFSSYREGLEVLSEAFRVPSSVEIVDPEVDDPIVVPLVETKVGGVAVKDGFAATVVTGRYYIETTVEIEDPESEDPENPDMITDTRTYQRVDTFHFKHELESVEQAPVMTTLPTVGFNSMARNNDILEDPDYVLFAGSRVVYVPTGTTVVQGSNGMSVTMTNGGVYKRILYSGSNFITHARVTDGVVDGTEEIPYGDAKGFKVVDFGDAGRVFTFEYDWVTGGEVNTSFKAFILTDEAPYVEETTIDGYTEVLFPYPDIRFEETADGVLLIGGGRDSAPDTTYVHRVSVDEDPENLGEYSININPMSLFEDEEAIDDVFLLFPVDEVRDFIATPVII